MEFFGRKRQPEKVPPCPFNALEPEGSKWAYIPVFFYGCQLPFDDVLYHHRGWMLAYFVKTAKGDFKGADTKQVENIFGHFDRRPQ